MRSRGRLRRSVRTDEQQPDSCRTDDRDVVDDEGRTWQRGRGKAPWYLTNERDASGVKVEYERSHEPNDDERQRAGHPGVGEPDAKDQRKRHEPDEQGRAV